MYSASNPPSGSTQITTETVTYTDKDGFSMIGYIAYNPTISSLQKAVLIVHHFAGRDEYINSRAEQFARAGYVGFALDVYGNGAIGKNLQENQGFMKPLLENRALLQQRIIAGLAVLRQKVFVDTSKIAAIGYCFGGLAVLDMARTNVDVCGVVSFHGSLNPLPAEIAAKYQPGPIKPKILVLHGYNDPVIPPNDVIAFQKEMNDRNADWEVDIYGDTVHSFTVPTANNPERAMYSARADKRSWAAMLRFFNEIFNE